MPATVFDGLADVFTDTSVFGEAVAYTPVATGIPIGAGGTINAIWTETSLDVVVGPEGVGTDSGKTTLAVRVADVTPAEGDTAVRVADGKTMKVATPILPDGYGLIVCELVTP